MYAGGRTPNEDEQNEERKKNTKECFKTVNKKKCIDKNGEKLRLPFRILIFWGVIAMLAFFIVCPFGTAADVNERRIGGIISCCFSSYYYY